MKIKRKTNNDETLSGFLAPCLIFFGSSGSRQKKKKKKKKSNSAP